MNDYTFGFKVLFPVSMLLFLTNTKSICTTTLAKIINLYVLYLYFISSYPILHQTMAEDSEFRPRLFIGGLQGAVDKDDLKFHFEEFG